MKTTVLTTSLSLSLLAGAAVPAALAQMSPAETRASVDALTRLSFVQASELMGSKVLNVNGKDIGSVDDLVVDRGSGRLTHVVIRHGGLLGFGGDRIAAPVDALTLSRTTPHVRVHANITPETIKNFDRVGGNSWFNVEDDNHWLDSIESDREHRLTDAQRHDRHADTVKNGTPAMIRGTIVGVERFDANRGHEHVAVKVKTESGATERIVFGPAWFVMSQTATPMRGETIAVSAVKIPRDSAGSMVARSYTIAGTQGVLRDANGAPHWDAERRSGTDMSSARSSVLLSDIIGSDATARRKDAGSIEGAIIELNSQRVAMLTLDPDENFLGIGDDIKCVPWSVAGFGSENVSIDADYDMLVASEYTPKRVIVLTRGDQLEPVFAAYDVEPVAFERTSTKKIERPVSWLSDDASKRWTKAYRNGDDFSLTGEVQSLSTMSFKTGDAPMRTLKLKTSDGTKTIVLGPERFIESQPWTLGKGTTVTVKGKTVTFDDEVCHMASSIDMPSTSSVTLWTDGSPRWLKK